jgi:hypothetical protein
MIAALQKAVAEVRSDEAGAAGNQDSSHRRDLSRNN